MTLAANLSEPFPLPAPVGGLNARDSLAAMPPMDAYVLDNMIADETSLSLRGGYLSLCDTGSASVESAAVYQSASAPHLLACAGGSIYNVTSGTAIAVGTGFTNNYWSSQYLNGSTVLFNGVDTPQKYDGTSCSAATYTGTGLTSSTLCHVNLYRSRLYMVQESSMKVWYTDVTSITGALTEFDFVRIFRNGGKLLWTATWTRDAGNGMDDLFVAASNRGEMVVYQGSYPGGSDWQIVGRFDIPELLGRRSYLLLGGDLVLLTSNGALPASSLTQYGRAVQATSQITDKINLFFKVLAANYSGNTGWDAIYYPRGNYILLNVPISSDVSVQYVCRLSSKSWSRFKNQNARCWIVCDNKLYFGDPSGNVFQADTGNSDNGSPISFACGQAYNLFQQNKNKLFTMIRPLMSIQGSLTLNMSVRADFSLKNITNPLNIINPNSSPWNTSPWNTSPWTIEKTISEWYGCGTFGRYGSVILEGEALNTGLEWHSTDILIEPSEGVI